MSQVEDSRTVVTLKAKAHAVKSSVVDDGELLITHPAKEWSADHALGHFDSQVPSTCAELKPLQALPSLTSTILDGVHNGGLFSQEEESASH